jgi:hypothetical protein
MVPQFFDEMCDHPLDISRSLPLADWLEERDDPIGGLIRLHNEWVNCRWNGEGNHLDYLERIPAYRRQHPEMYGFLSQDCYRPRGHFGMLSLDMSAKDFLTLNDVVDDELWQWVAALQVRIATDRVMEMLNHPRFQTVRKLELDDFRTRRDDEGERLAVADSQLDVLVKLKLPKLRALELDCNRLRLSTITKLASAPWWKQINWMELSPDNFESPDYYEPDALMEAMPPLQGIYLKKLSGLDAVDGLSDIVNRLPTTLRRIYLDSNYHGEFNADWSRLPNLEGVHYNPSRRRRDLPQIVFPRPYPYLWHGNTLYSH